MKQSKKFVVGLLALTVLLFGYSIWVTVRVRSLEQQLNRVEVSYRDLQVRHRALVSALVRTDALSAAQARVDLLRDSLGVPPATVMETRPTISEVNRMPQTPTIK